MATMRCSKLLPPVLVGLFSSNQKASIVAVGLASGKVNLRLQPQEDDEYERTLTHALRNNM